MAPRAIPLLLVMLLTAGAAEAAPQTPLQAFTQFLENAGDSLTNATAPPRTVPRAPAPNQVLASAPLPNLRPDEDADFVPGIAPGAVDNPEGVASAAPALASAPKADQAPVSQPATATAGAPVPSAPQSSVPAPSLSLAPPPAPPAASAGPTGPAPFAIASIAPITLSGAAPVASPAVEPASPDADATPLAAIPTYHPRPPVPAAPAQVAAVAATIAPPAATAPGAPPPAAAASPPKTTAATVAAAKDAPRPKIPAESTTSCAVALAAFHVKAEPAIAPSEGECRVSSPVTLASAGDIALMPKALVDCATAATLASWLQDVVAPKAEAMFGAKLTAIRDLDAWNCRTVDNIPGANFSEHSRGLAIDVSAFRVGQRWITVGAKELTDDDQKFLDAVRASACGPFTTVLGPGSDEFHTNHFHLDLQQRQTAGPSKGLYCQ